MFKTTAFLLITLCGLQARSPAQLQLGLNIGKRLGVHASVGPQSCSTGSSFRASSNCDVAHRRPHSHTRWVTRKVWVPGRYERVYVPPVYRTVRSSCCRSVKVLVRPGSHRNVYKAGYFKQVRKRVRTAC